MAQKKDTNWLLIGVIGLFMILGIVLYMRGGTGAGEARRFNPYADTAVDITYPTTYPTTYPVGDTFGPVGGEPVAFIPPFADTGWERCYDKADVAYDICKRNCDVNFQAALADCIINPRPGCVDDAKFDDQTCFMICVSHWTSDWDKCDKK